MRGLMMEKQLLVSSILDHAALYHGDTEIVSVNTNGGETRTNYANVKARAIKLASHFSKRGLEKSDRVATLAWNNHRHLELYYGISGNGQVCHTINPRLFPDQIIYIINHAQDRILFFDQTFLPLVASIKDKLNTVASFILLEEKSDTIAQEHPWVEFYEEFVAQGDDDYDWPQVDENDASGLCYTSGHNGQPKRCALFKQNNPNSCNDVSNT